MNMASTNPTLESSTAVSQPTSLTKTLVTVLADVRILMGAGTVLLPHPSASLFGLPLTSATRTIGQFFGVRELVLGGLLYTAYSDYLKSFRGDGIPLKATSDVTNSTKLERKQNLKNVLWACLAIDSIDLGCVAFNAFKGDLAMRGVCLSGGAGLLGILFAGSALRSL